MGHGHSVALFQCLMIYLGLTLTLYGWGDFATSKLGSGARPGMHSLKVWLGSAITIFVVQVAHFFSAISATIVFTVFAVGIARTLYVWSRTQPLKARRPGLKGWAEKLAWTALTLIVMAWFASRSMLPDLTGDSGLYHFNSVRWANEYALIPGLGNLHDRLAFNQSYFGWVAFLNFHPYFGQGRVVANSFVFLLVLATIAEIFRPAIANHSRFITSHPFRYGPALLMLAPLLLLALRPKLLMSPSPDLFSTLMQYLMFLLFALWLARREYLHPRLSEIELVLVFIAATALSVKLSNAVYSLALTATLAWVRFRHARLSRLGTAGLAVIFAIIVGVYALRGYLLSGAPFFPSTFARIDFSWAMPEQAISHTSKAITVFARQRGTDVGLGEALEGWSWLGPWFRFISTDMVDFSWPLGSFAICLLLLLWIYRRDLTSVDSRFWLLLVPLLPSLTFWFLTAPDVRFAHAQIKLLSIAAGLALMCVGFKKLRGNRLLASYVAIFLIINFSNLDYVVQYSNGFKEISRSGFGSIPEAKLGTKVTDSGLLVQTPLEGQLVWDSPLPATPYFRQELKLRKDGDLSSGFLIQSSE